MAKQAQQYDPDAEYIKLWVPEVSHLPSKLAMAPWDAGVGGRRKAGVPDIYPDQPVFRPGYSAEARSRNEQRSKDEGAEVTAAGYPLAKRRWHRGRNAAFLAS